MHKANWDDLRYVLAVADRGSVSAAARALGVNHATVLRRVAAFEERQGGVIFDKTASGYVIAPGQQRVIDAAREVEAAVLGVTRVIEGLHAPLSGVVRVTSTDTFCHGILPRLLPEIRREAPELRIDLICSNAHLDLARLDADIAIRPAVALPEGLSGEIAAELGFAVYGDPEGPWLGFSGPLAKSKPAPWLAEQAPEDRRAGSADSFLSLREMVASGLGRTILPCLLGDAEPRIARIEHDMPDLAVPIWVATHPDMAEVPRIRAVRDRVIEGLRAEEADLRG